MDPKIVVTEPSSFSSSTPSISGTSASVPSSSFSSVPSDMQVGVSGKNQLGKDRIIYCGSNCFSYIRI